jgi:hypothetical protein
MLEKPLRPPSALLGLNKILTKIVIEPVCDVVKRTRLSKECGQAHENPVFLAVHSLASPSGLLGVAGSSITLGTQ